MALTLRSTKGSALTHIELDANFTTLDTKIDNNVLSNTSVLVNFTEVNGKVLYNGSEIDGSGSGFGQTASEILAELPSI